MVDDIQSFAQALGQRVEGVITAEQAQVLVLARCQALEVEKLIEAHEGLVRLSSSGMERLSTSVAKSELMRAQFRASLLARRHGHALSTVQAAEVGDAAASFLDECITRRSLGVAMALSVTRTDQQNYHMVALLQGLKTQLATMQDAAQARALIATVQEALAGPTEIEEEYIGTALQAGFGVHLLGFNQDTMRVRLEDLSSTAFILDATTLIPALALGSRGHDAAAEASDSDAAS